MLAIRAVRVLKTHPGRRIALDTGLDGLVLTKSNAGGRSFSCFQQLHRFGFR